MDSTLALMKAYAAHRQIATTTLGRLAAGSSTLVERLEKGRVTIATITRVHQWLANNWPDGLEWPRDIPRPPRDAV